MDFVHLNFHSDFSLRDSCCAIKKLPKECAEKKFKAVALTDTCNIRGAIKFYKACAFAENPVKPILGTKLLIKDEKNYPLIVLVKDDAGFHNLKLLSNNSQVEGWNNETKKPLTDIEFLRAHSDGLICIATDINGSVNRLARRDQLQEAYKEASMLKDIFGEDLYLEVQENSQLDQSKINKNIMKISKKLGSKIVATNDVRYYNKKDYIAHVALIADRKRTTITSDKFTYLKTRERYFKTYEEMKDAFKDYPLEFLTNTVEVSDKCNLNLEFGGMRLPEYELPDGFTSDWEYLKHLAFKGLSDRGFGGNQEYIDRLNDELFDVRMVNEVKKYNFSRYFLMVWDYVNHAHEIGCKIGVGRGCLTYDSLVRVEGDRFKKLGEVIKGDRVLNRFGEYDKVINTMKYECDEELLEFRSRCDSNISSKSMTKDHKVLAIKNPFVEMEGNGWIKGYGNLDKKDFFNIDNLSWYEADKLDKGDYLVRSVDYEEEKDMESIDLAKYSYDMEYDDEFIYEVHPHSKDYIFSLRKLAAHSGLSRSSLNLIKNGKIKSVRNQYGVGRLIDYLESNNKTLDDFIEMKNYEFQKINRFIKVDKEFIYFYGIYVGDGWNRKGRVGTAYHSVNNMKSKNRVEKFLKDNGFSVTEFKSNNGKMLIQLVANSLVLNRLIDDICPNYSTSREINQQFMNLPKSKKEHLLDGLMNSDGHTGVKMCYDTTCMTLAFQVRKLWESCGYVCAIRKRNSFVHRGYECRESYKVVIMNNTKSSNYYNDGRYIYTRITEKKYVKNTTGFVYDITVENNPSYHTDDYIVHNSACGSLLLYCLRITNVDPIDYQLYWWRFLTVDKSYIIEKKDFV